MPFDFQALLDAAHALIRDPAFWWEVGVLLLAAAGAWMVHRTLGQSLAARTDAGEDYTVRNLALKTLQRVLFPISMLLGVLAGRVLLSLNDYPVKLLDLAIPLLVSLATIRILIYFLRKTFRPGPAVKAWETSSPPRYGSSSRCTCWAGCLQYWKAWTEWRCRSAARGFPCSRRSS